MLVIWQQEGAMWKDSKKFINEYIMAVMATAVLGCSVEGVKCQYFWSQLKEYRLLPVYNALL